MEAEVREQFPGVPVAWAYTAHKVRRKLAARGQSQDSVAVALSRLHDDGVTHLVVQSLHTVPGVEYHWTRDQALAYQHPRKGFQQVVIGSPLLTSEEDLARARQALAGYIPPERRQEEAVVLVGHGTYHHGQQRYLDFEACIRQDDPLAFLGALMGRPGERLGIAAVLDRLQAAGAARCWLVPFMSVPGHHVQVDILGQSSRSWKTMLQAAGIEVLTRPTGTLEHAPFRALWMEHLRHAFTSLQQEHPAASCGHHHGEHHAHF
ncbi:sirohydrochlorin cobaltochelatase [Megalodesulfovibrio paquesii]